MRPLLAPRHGTAHFYGLRDRLWPEPREQDWLQPVMVGFPEDEAGALQECRRRLAEATAGRHKSHPDVDVTHEVLRGHPVEELATAAEHALAAVVGRRGSEGFSGMRLGSVPHGLLQRARCPVVTLSPTYRGAH